MVHFAFIVFVTVGGFLLLRWRRLVWGHVPAVLWGAYVEITGRVCPLTPLENRFRRAGGEAGYEGGFIDHYIGRIVYPEDYGPEMRMAFLGLLVVLNGTAYFLFFRRR